MNNIQPFLLNHGGPVLFGLVLAEQAGLPIPAAPWLLAAGALSASGMLNPLLAIALTTLACLVADAAWFYIGRRGGQRVLRLFCRLSLSPNSCVGSTKGFLARHGAQGLVAAKFIPVLGGVMPPLAGALGMSTSRFLALDGLGSILYGTLYIAAGNIFHTQLRQIGAMLNEFGLSVLLLTTLAVPAYILFKYLRRRKPLVQRTRADAPSQTTDALEQSGGLIQSELLVPSASPMPVALNSRTLSRVSAGWQSVSDHAPTIVQTTPCSL